MKTYIMQNEDQDGKDVEKLIEKGDSSTLMITESYREQLANTLLSEDKEKRKEALEIAKCSKEYWTERDRVITEREEQDGSIEIADDGTLIVKEKILYHGSNMSNIKEFKYSDDNTTIGDGVYLTNGSGAYNYANGRANKVPTIYETKIENVRIVDLCNKKILQIVMEGFTKILIDELRRKDVPSWYPGSVADAIHAIREGITLQTIQKVTNQFSAKFTKYLTDLGYDGLVGTEGGEGGHFGNHVSWVIFDPKKVKIVQEHFVGSDSVTDINF